MSVLKNIKQVENAVEPKNDDAEEEAAEAPMEEEAAGASYGAGASGAGGGLPDVRETKTGRRSRRVCRGGISSPHCSRMSRC